MKFLAVEHCETKGQYVPYFKLEGKELIPRITNGIIDIPFTKERQCYCNIVEISKEKWEKLVRNLSIQKYPDKEGDLYLIGGILFTASRIYDLTLEEMKKHNLFGKTRVTATNPIHDILGYGTTDYALQMRA